MSKFINLVLFIFCTFSMLISSAYAQSDDYTKAHVGPRYHPIYSGELCSDYFDTETLRFVRDKNGKIQENIVDVWILTIYTKAGIDNMIKHQKEQGQYTPAWDNFKTTLFHNQYELITHKYWVEKMIFYADPKKEITVFNLNYTGTDERFIPIVPSTEEEIPFKAIKKYVQENREHILNQS